MPSLMTRQQAAQLAQNGENNAQDNGKGAGKGGSRRALNDISNAVGSVTARVFGKENGSSKALANANAGLEKHRPSKQSMTWGSGGNGAFARSRSGPSTSSVLNSRMEESLGGRARSDRVMEDVEAASLHSHEKLQAAFDIDSKDKGNPLACTIYIQDIQRHYKRIENKTAISPGYMQRQDDINDKMRAILNDWLIEVHLKFKLMPETLYLTVNLIDRFLSKQQVTRKNLQLVGITAMLLASKYEEIWAPEVRDFVYISDKAYTRDQILEMEKVMLNVLHFNLTIPTQYAFLCRYFKAAGADKQTEVCALFLLELCMPDYGMLAFSPSLVAAAALYVAQLTLRKVQPWTGALEFHTGYSEDNLKQCAQHICSIQSKASSASLMAAYKKYSTPKFLEVAKLTPVLNQAGKDVMAA
mmetsp:Transcript_13505/g.49130  ORF Transcript_13505/g.49130 Transcript_13505/m.49130 type:complete len:414 (+) Transcript_13505:248-1489(+)